jgi:hypothetical protein
MEESHQTRQLKYHGPSFLLDDHSMIAVTAVSGDDEEHDPFQESKYNVQATYSDLRLLIFLGLA